MKIGPRLSASECKTETLVIYVLGIVDMLKSGEIVLAQKSIRFKTKPFI